MKRIFTVFVGRSEAPRGASLLRVGGGNDGLRQGFGRHAQFAGEELGQQRVAQFGQRARFISPKGRSNPARGNGLGTMPRTNPKP